MKGQTSMELIMIVGIVVIMTFAVGTKYLNAQGEIFIDSAARQSFISESSKLDTKYYLKKTEVLECENDVKINYVTEPKPAAAGFDEAQLQTKIEIAVREVPAVQGRFVTITFNSATLTC